LWNSLPLYVVNSVSVNSFKTDIDKFRGTEDVYCDYKCDMPELETEVLVINSFLSILIERS